MTKPSVFEVSVTQEDKDKINETRLSKTFIEDCLNVAHKLKKQEKRIK